MRYNSRKKYGPSAFGVVVYGLIISGFLSIFLISPIIHFSTMEMTSGHVVVEKERINTKDTSKYMIFTDKEVFENTDSFLSLKWNSSDVYRDVKIGDTCTFKVTGIRVPFMSWYRNILEAHCQKGIEN